MDDDPEMPYDDGEMSLPLLDPRRRIDIACFSRDGARLLTVQGPLGAQLWDTATGGLVGRLVPGSPIAGAPLGPMGAPFELFIEAAALDGSGDLVLLGLNDGTAGLFSSAGERLLTLAVPDRSRALERVRAVAFSRDGSLIGAGFPGWSVGVWSRGGELRALLRYPHVAPRSFDDTTVETIAWSRDDRHLFAGFGDGTAAVWDIASGERVFEALEHRGAILDFDCAQGVLRWATSGGAVWEGRPDRGARKVMSAGVAWEEVVFAPGGASLLARTPGGAVRRWTLDGGSEGLADMAGAASFAGGASTLGFSRGGDALFFPDGPRRLAIRADGHVAHAERNAQLVQALVSPGGDLLATRGWSRTVELWQVPGGELRSVIDVPAEVGSMAFSPDGAFLALGELGRGSGAPCSVVVWSVEAGRRRCTLAGHTHPIDSVVWTADGQCVVTASADGAVRCYHVGGPGPRAIGQIRCADLDSRSLAALPGGRVVVFRRGSIEVWHLLDRLLLRLPVTLAASLRWKISSDGRHLLAARPDQSVEIWSLDRGERVNVLRPEIARPAPLVTVDLFRRCRPTAWPSLWRAPGGPYLHPPSAPRGADARLSLADDDRHLVLPTTSGATLLAVDVDGDPRIVEDFPMRGRMRAGWVGRREVRIVDGEGRLYRFQRSELPALD